MANKIVGISVGDRFTDMITVHTDVHGVDSQIRYAKVLNDFDDPLKAQSAALRQSGVTLENVAAFIHATHSVENALRDRQLTKMGLITTDGFRDLLELGTGERARRFGFSSPPQALIPRDRRMEVSERIDASGTVLEPLDEEAVAGAVEHLKKRGAEAVVIHFLNAWANPMHEWRAYEIVQDIWPNVPTVTAHSYLNAAGEFERGAGATANLGLSKGVETFIGHLKESFKDKDFDGDLLLMRRNGGAVSAERAPYHALDLVGASPAAAAMAVAYTAHSANLQTVISCEVGATQCYLTLIEEGHTKQTVEHRFDSRLPLPHLAVDCEAYPFGGEALIGFDHLGALAVGPLMARLDKGPIAFGKGSKRPTLMDAELILGRLNPNRIHGSDKKVDLDAVKEIFKEQIALKLSMTAEEAAGAVLTLATDCLARYIRLFSLKHGLNPAETPVILHGGGGPLYGSQLARLLGGPKIVIPARPGLTAALGCLLADLRHDFRRSIDQYLHRLDFEIVHEILVEQTERGEQAIARDGASYEGLSFSHMADLRVSGQDSLFSIRFEDPEIDEDWLRDMFSQAYEKRFGLKPKPSSVMLVDLHTTIIARRKGLGLSVLTGARKQKASMEDALIGKRHVWFRDGLQETPIYRRESLRAGSSFLGPCVIEQMDSTIIVAPLDHVKNDEAGNLTITIRTQT